MFKFVPPMTLGEWFFLGLVALIAVGVYYLLQFLSAAL
jgi:hypothetical protein